MLLFAVSPQQALSMLQHLESYSNLAQSCVFYVDGVTDAASKDEKKR